MTLLNNVKWDEITLYHGTTKNSWFRIEQDGYVIPSETNWLGRGIYFGVNNVITPIKYALQQAIAKGDEPVIVQIQANQLKKIYTNRILDLTTDRGLIYFFLISNRFKDLVDELNKDEVTMDYRANFLKSVLYSDIPKKFLSLDMEWYLFTKAIEPIFNIDFKTNLLDELKQISNIHISNLVIDWYNYLESCGREDDVPIKGVLASFNAGDPLLLSPYLTEFADKKSQMIRDERVFFDFTSCLNRVELSIFGFEYYKSYDHKCMWNIGELFDNGIKPDKLFSGKDAIKNKLLNVIVESGFPDLDECEKYSNLLFEFINKQKDLL